MNLSNVTAQQLRAAADLKERIDALQNELNELLGGEVSAPALVAVETPEKPANGRRREKRKKVSAEGRASIAAAQRARWAAKKGVTVAAEPDQPVEKPKRKRSAAWSKALSEAMKKRWAKVRRAGKSSL
jgi:hypothetical protein